MKMLTKKRLALIIACAMIIGIAFNAVFASDAYDTGQRIMSRQYNKVQKNEYRLNEAYDNAKEKCQSKFNTNSQIRECKQGAKDKYEKILANNGNSSNDNCSNHYSSYACNADPNCKWDTYNYICKEATPEVPECQRYKRKQACNADGNCQWDYYNNICKTANQGVEECNDHTRPRPCNADANCEWDNYKNICKETTPVVQGCQKYQRKQACNADRNCQWDYYNNICEDSNQGGLEQQVKEEFTKAQKTYNMLTQIDSYIRNIKTTIDQYQYIVYKNNRPSYSTTEKCDAIGDNYNKCIDSGCSWDNDFDVCMSTYSEAPQDWNNALQYYQNATQSFTNMVDTYIGPNGPAALNAAFLAEFNACWDLQCKLNAIERYQQRLSQVVSIICSSMYSAEQTLRLARFSLDQCNPWDAPPGFIDMMNDAIDALLNDIFLIRGVVNICPF